jgi:hypothetical protein
MKRLLLAFFLLIGVAHTHAQDVSGELLARVNNLRASLGLAAYTWNGALAAAAANQARWMVDNNQVSHVQFDGSRPRDRASAAGYNSQWVSENIYMGGLASIDSAWNFWLNSAVHYAGLTNANYNDIGIASATGSGGQSFVLVFGNSTGAWQTFNSASASNADSAAVAAAPPLPIVGVDNSGNIMYEVQAGDDIGTIALLFGYTWDDIPYMLELNQMTQEDIRLLKTGSVFLVPSASGTYTPTPEPTRDPTIPTETATPTPTATETITATPTITPTSTDLPPAVYVQPSVTPTRPMIVRTVAPSTQVAMVVTQPLQEATTPEPPTQSSPPVWLVIAIGAQVGVLGIAAFQFVRRK